MCFLFLQRRDKQRMKDGESMQSCRQASAGKSLVGFPGECRQADSLSVPVRLCRAVSGFLCEWVNLWIL